MISSSLVLFPSDSLPPYDPVRLVQTLIPTTLQPHEILVSIAAAALNHREVGTQTYHRLYPLIRFRYGSGSVCIQQLYMGLLSVQMVQVTTQSPPLNPHLIRLLGTVIASGTANDPLLNKRVFLNPSRGWDKHPIAPESKYGPFHFWNPTLIMIDKVSAFWVVEQTPQSVLSQNTSSWNVIKSFQHPIT